MPVTAAAIATGLSAIKNGFEITKSIREQVKKPTIDPNEVSGQLLLLQQVMLDAQKSLNDAQEEIQSLKSDLDAASNTVATQAELEWVQDGGFWVRKSDKVTGIKYCPLCWGDKGKLIPLNPLFNEGLLRCDLHQSTYETSEYRARQNRLNQQSSGEYY